MSVRQRLSRFPRLFANSELYTSVKRDQPNSPPEGNGHSRRKKYRNASAENFEITSIGSTTLPSDLLIFSTVPDSSFLTYTKPCAKTFFGASSPAAHSIAGHSAQWNRVMSL